MPLMQMSQKTSLLFQSAEINDEQAAARLQDSAHIPDAPFAEFARQMMKHQRAQDEVELTIRERERFDGFVFEEDIEPGLSRLRAGPRDHLGRGVDSLDAGGRTDAPFGGDGERACPAAHIEDGLAGIGRSKIEHLLPESPLASA